MAITLDGTTGITSPALLGLTVLGTTSIEEVIEKVSVDTSTTGTINFDALTSAVQYYTVAQTADRTINFRGDGSTTLN